MLILMARAAGELPRISVEGEEYFAELDARAAAKTPEPVAHS